MTSPLQNPFAPKPAAQSDPDAFLMSGGATGAQFPEIGHSYTGTVLSKRVQQQRNFDDNSPLFWDDGAPKMHMPVEIQCEPTGYKFDDEGQKVPLLDDDGKRTLYVKGKMQAAIRDAVLKAGAKTLELGGVLTVTYTGKGQKTGNLKPPKLYSAVYVPVGQAAADAALME